VNLSTKPRLRHFSSFYQKKLQSENGRYRWEALFVSSLDRFPVIVTLRGDNWWRIKIVTLKVDHFVASETDHFVASETDHFVASETGRFL